MTMTMTRWMKEINGELRYKVLRKVEKGSNEVYLDIVDTHNNNKSEGFYTLLDTDSRKIHLLQSEGGINYGIIAALELRDILELNRTFSCSLGESLIK